MIAKLIPACLQSETNSTSSVNHSSSYLDLLLNPLSGFFDGANDTFQAAVDRNNNGEDLGYDPIQEKASIATRLTQQESSEEPEDNEESIVSDLTHEDVDEDDNENHPAIEIENETQPTAEASLPLPTPRKLVFENLPSPAQRKRKTRVWFSPLACVIPIPSHHDYSQAERDNTWSSFDEQHINAIRNRIEFQYEGHDWRNVLEERHMFVDSNGELVHPAILEFINLWWHQIGNPLSKFPQATAPINESLLSIVYHNYSPQRRSPMMT